LSFTPPAPLVFLLVHPPAQLLAGEVALAEAGRGTLYVSVCVTCELDLWLVLENMTTLASFWCQQEFICWRKHHRDVRSALRLC